MPEPQDQALWSCGSAKRPLYISNLTFVGIIDSTSMGIAMLEGDTRDTCAVTVNLEMLARNNDQAILKTEVRSAGARRMPMEKNEDSFFVHDNAHWMLFMYGTLIMN